MAVYADDVGGSTADFNAYWSSQVADSSLSIQVLNAPFLPNLDLISFMLGI
jgi:hypothetical protein